jgi:hypothetical protein
MELVVLVLASDAVVVSVVVADVEAVTVVESAESAGGGGGGPPGTLLNADCRSLANSSWLTPYDSSNWVKSASDIVVVPVVVPAAAPVVDVELSVVPVVDVVELSCDWFSTLAMASWTTWLRSSLPSEDCRADVTADSILLFMSSVLPEGGGGGVPPPWSPVTLEKAVLRSAMNSSWLIPYDCRTEAKSLPVVEVEEVVESVVPWALCSVLRTLSIVSWTT